LNTGVKGFNFMKEMGYNVQGVIDPIIVEIMLENEGLVFGGKDEVGKC
jgi:hypothetical protein